MIKFWQRVGVRTGVLLTVLLAVTLTAGPQADAATHVTKDAKRDTYVMTDADGQYLIKKPTTNGDITALRTSHRAKGLDVVIKARQLRRGYTFGGIEVATPAKHRPRYQFAFEIGPKGRTQVALIKGVDREVSCRGARVRREAGHALIRAHIPRSCLGNPRWVRTGAFLMSSSQRFREDPTIDVAGKKLLTEGWLRGSAHLPLGPRVAAAH